MFTDFLYHTFEVPAQACFVLKLIKIISINKEI